MRKINEENRGREAWWEIWAEFGKKAVLYTLATFHNQSNSSQYKQRYYYLHHIQTHFTLELQFGPQQNTAQIPTFQSPSLHLNIHAIP